MSYGHSAVIFKPAAKKFGSKNFYKGNCFDLSRAFGLLNALEKPKHRIRPRTGYDAFCFFVPYRVIISVMD